MGIIRFAVKSSVAGGIVYYTIQEGLWSSSEESIKLYAKAYNTVAPYIKENVPKEVVNEIPKLPSMSDLSQFFKVKYNKGVIASIEFLSELPSHVSNGVTGLYNQVNNQLKQASTDKLS